MRRIIVTGATGFIGRTTLQPLLDRGFEVIALTSREIEDPVPAVEYMIADLTNPEDLRRAIKIAKATDLLHLAWRAVISGLWTAPENMAWIKISLDLVEAFTEAGGKRVTVCGSSGDYDWTSGLCVEGGVTPLMPSTFYGRAKVALFHALAGYCDTNDVEFAWGRVFFLYGPREHPSRLGASVALSLLRGEDAECSHGMQLRDYLHVQDAGEGMAALAASNLTGDYNIGSGVAVRVKDVILALAEAAGRPDLVKLGARSAPAYEPPLIVADMTKVRKAELDWEPKFDLQAGAADTIEWFKSQL